MTIVEQLRATGRAMARADDGNDRATAPLLHQAADLIVEQEQLFKNLEPHEFAPSIAKEFCDRCGQIATEPHHVVITTIRNLEKQAGWENELRGKIAELEQQIARWEQVSDDNLAHGVQTPGSRPRCSEYERAEKAEARAKDFEELADRCQRSALRNRDERKKAEVRVQELEQQIEAQRALLKEWTDLSDRMDPHITGTLAQLAAYRAFVAAFEELKQARDDHTDMATTARLWNECGDALREVKRVDPT